MEFTTTDMIIAVLIMIGCGIAILIRNLSKPNYSGPEECFDCNKTTCKGCPIWDPDPGML